MELITLDVEENFGKELFFRIALDADDPQGNDIPGLEDEIHQLLETIGAELGLPVTNAIYVHIANAFIVPELEAYVRAHMYPVKIRPEKFYGHHKAPHYNVQVPKDYFYMFVYKAIEDTRQKISTKYSELWWKIQQKRVKYFYIEKTERRIDSNIVQLSTATITIDKEVYTIYINDFCDQYTTLTPGNELIIGARRGSEDGRYYWEHLNGDRFLMSDNEAIAYQCLINYIDGEPLDEEFKIY